MANGQSIRQRQELTQALKHKTKPQQVLEARLLEMSLDTLKDRIQEEMVVNPYLEAHTDNDAESEEHTTKQEADKTTHDAEEYDPDNVPEPNNGVYEGPERQITEQETLYDHLMAQINDFEMTERQRGFVTYLIGCIDGDGRLEATLQQIADDLYINQDIDVPEHELEESLQILQQFDPAGVGGRSVQECLLIQARRSQSERMKRLFSILFSPRNYNLFTHQHWDTIRQNNKLTAADISYIKHNTRFFDPYPGRSFGSVANNDIIKPDFELTINDGKIDLQLNEGEIPTLTLDTDDLQEALQIAKKSKETAMEKVYRGYADNGKFFIEALKSRRETMIGTMKTIIAMQQDFFLDGDESLLRPMTLEDVASRTGQDLSTVSRVSRNKYIQTPYGTYALKWFFSARAKMDDEDVSIREVKNVLKELISSEPKDKPMSDEKLAAELSQKGFKVARRTVAKYRDQMGIPTASIRRRSI